MKILGFVKKVKECYFDLEQIKKHVLATFEKLTFSSEIWSLCEI